jgi:hypothetical protein
MKRLGTGGGALAEALHEMPCHVKPGLTRPRQPEARRHTCGHLHTVWIGFKRSRVRTVWELRHLYITDDTLIRVFPRPYTPPNFYEPGSAAPLSLAATGLELSATAVVCSAPADVPLRVAGATGPQLVMMSSFGGSGDGISVDMS